MINYKSIKWGYGLIAVLVLGISGCYLDGSSPQERGYYSQNNNMSAERQTATNEAQPQQKSYASKDPAQKSTPGPKRTAAPQLPVIQ